MIENNIKEKIENLTIRLLEIVHLHCWNNISKNLMFILSDISEVKGENFFIKRRNKNKLNKKKNPKNLNEVIEDLQEIYDLIYDINLYVYKSEKHKTIIEIQYFLKSKLDTDYLKTAANNPPMLHCKIAQPPYKNDQEKFDVNWELGGIRYYLNILWWKINYNMHKRLILLHNLHKS
ncbi:hypothetical protein [Flavobacterium johnsoniae]|jgi:hypothetical protein|uniref:Uncharacterized protein n=1 Tax=Flavobacterium johnsoniae (strain ATCC 17061 / DSM 2064 / JCM 8514 / BCRC 14874 / CCUG 350202 / NBRC 14942 / NCIMB 11054 / UW101) TaxID=376686 RepID=A5FHJ2_FLAJ1|nr:hypothetical protein [Flavobacterium johnsoniae]ABQ05323.1 hypothetical protein Fjoh_2296 [Flavobacterium johnsoniae UW101]OXE95033.1 hypothetical protein B0A63_25885 [Flavobacterium johnsoniae UW101]WQG82874.1 hypothetical protein SR927_07060 [Flavobacterium johnsoniae UW101]SHL59845.1 hypothetical protein SAMN05444146_4180 [Flavobacterium johnsoniae]